jgi:hypothetical protein
MTDNEKAATFVGWSLAATCGDGKNADCNHDFWHTREMQNPAPDMSDPKQFWKALEARAAQISPMVDSGAAWDHLLDAIYISLRAKDNAAIVRYLARRYDEERSTGSAEHKETE